ncbi:PaaI family thioesterase, partial [Mycobacterium sp. ITM-2017-0098]
IALVERELQVEAAIDDIVDRKIFVSGRLLDGDHVLAEAHSLFGKLKPGQP